MRYASNGSTVDVEFQVNAYTTGYQRSPAVAVEPDGDFIVVWQSSDSSFSDTSNFSIQGLRFSSNGSDLGSQFQVNSYTTNYQGHPTLALDPDGGFVVTWYSYGSGDSDVSLLSIHGQRFASNGTTIGRHPSCTIQVNHPGISKEHCRLARAIDDSWRVHDLGSTNGTAVNGHKVEQTDLKHGDEIRVGKLVFSFADPRSDDLGISDVTLLSEADQPIKTLLEIRHDYRPAPEIIGLFGAPVEQDRDPIRAVCCALDMLRALDEFNLVRANRAEEAIAVGIGINTGPVVAGAIGSPKALQYTVIGDAVNVAARLCSQAGPGEVIISQSTYDGCDGQLKADARPPVRVKGKSEPVALYQAIAVSTNEADPSAEKTPTRGGCEPTPLLGHKHPGVRG